MCIIGGEQASEDQVKKSRGSASDNGYSDKYQSMSYRFRSSKATRECDKDKDEIGQSHLPNIKE